MLATRPPRTPTHPTRNLEDPSIADGVEHKTQGKSVPAKPFIKWVGGKRSILPQLLARMPKEYGEYLEPFVGGGALFFAVRPKRAFLSDVNLHLVVAYAAVRDNVEEVIRLLKKHEDKHSKAYYLEARKRLAKEPNPAVIASLLIYLNKTGYNGLYRVNGAGEYNVPIGDYVSPNIVDEETLRADSRVLTKASIEQGDFSQVRPRKNAFYYLDPPYHETYDGYSGTGFDDDKHRELAQFCHKIDERGGRFMLSNSDTSLVRALWGKYHVEEIQSTRSVSCKSYSRGKANELVIRNYR
jgi:DNA adenine methylase